MDVDCTRVSVGCKVTLADTGSSDGDWVVMRAPCTRTSGSRPRTSPPLRSSRRALGRPKSKFRPERVTPRPVIEGPQTAPSVVCPSGAQPEEIHTDEHRPVQGQVPLGSRPGDGRQGATAWMRVSQLQTSGSMMLPRLGWEVTVEFLEGDPDRPIVTGAALFTTASTCRPTPCPRARRARPSRPRARRAAQAATRSGWRTNPDPKRS